MTAADPDRSMPRADDPIAEVRNLTVAFEMDRGQSRVVDDLSVDIERGEILGVVGESGSGKSMFASSLMDAVVEPGVASGDVTYHPPSGESVDVLELSKGELQELRWEEVAMVFQGAMSSFNPVRTIRDHFVETLSAHDYNVSDGLERARELISDLYMDPERVLSSYPHELSGGMSQRVLIALSLILDPELLVMDEPTAALDLLMQRSIISLLDGIQEKHDLSIVFITHDLPLVAGLADRIAVMYAFEMVEMGPTDELLTDAAHPYTRALLNSTPNLRAPIDRMRSIDGESPDPVNIPSGCSYHPRCPMADEQCREVDPEPYRVDGDHAANCHYWEEAAEAVPAVTEEFDDAGEMGAAATERTPERRSGEPVLSMDDVEVYFEQESSAFSLFSDPDDVKAVDGIDLDVYDEDVVVLVGESGCGKTTLGKTAIGLQRPTGGVVEYRGQDVWQARDLVGDIDIPYEEIRQSLQIIHQDPGSALNTHRRVRAVLETPLKRWYPELDGNDRRERILGMLEYVGMTPPEDYIDRYPFQLSGGEMQRIALIRALLINPELILADEAVSALDVSLRVEMMDLLLELQDTFDTSYLFISHNLANARYITEKADGRIGVMYLGELVEIGSPERIINDPKHPYTQALRWATPELDPDDDPGERPMRKIDIPDAANPPSGCRYHTRCPEAREACRHQRPELVEAEGEEPGYQQAACFREYEDHEYWDSEPITDEDDADSVDSGTGPGTAEADD
ncbi:ABC transporter ATP-binding protein [Saliphagus infecundisoli]|uniref:ABC transporter ATP-binding protein n=1 Tax=Saliphagus infecundisoli TaxID=1849069 RepID=A0ABD5QIJ6_9EURY|nr:ABC transporter ATP-binding protein [Saliphagus infecundisoli]